MLRRWLKSPPFELLGDGGEAFEGCRGNDEPECGEKRRQSKGGGDNASGVTVREKNQRAGKRDESRQESAARGGEQNSDEAEWAEIRRP